MKKVSRRKLQVVIGRIIERIVYLANAMHIEASELFSIVAALSWAMPLALQPWLLDSSPYLRHLQGHVPYPVATGIAWFLLLYQSVGVLVGGLPSALIGDGHSRFAWMRARQAGLWAAMFVWWTLSGLLASTGVLTPGTILYGALGFLCFWGAERLRFNLKVDSEYNAMKQIREEAIEEERRKLGIVA